MATTTGCSGQLDPATADGLRAARLARGWSYRRVAREAGISAGYLHLLDHGQRRPSYSVALALVDALGLDPMLARDLLDQAVLDAGRDSPLRRTVGQNLGWEKATPVPARPGSLKTGR